MPEAMWRVNGRKSKVRARGLFIRAIGIARAEAVIMFANMVFNMKRWCWLERNPAAA